MGGQLDVEELYRALKAKENAKLLASQELHTRNFQWLNDIVEEAKALFKKDPIKANELDAPDGCKTIAENETQDLDDSSGSAILPILLPKTPRVRLFIEC